MRANHYKDFSQPQDKKKKKNHNRTQILTQLIHTKACSSSTKVHTNCTGCFFVFSPASHLSSHYKLILKAYTVTKQSSHMIRFLSCQFDGIKRKLYEAALLQSDCVRHICQSMHQGIKHKHLTEQPYYFHLSKGVLALLS